MALKAPLYLIHWSTNIKASNCKPLDRRAVQVNKYNKFARSFEPQPEKRYYECVWQPHSGCRQHFSGENAGNASILTKLGKKCQRMPIFQHS
jgi:hypothetical protein